MKTKLSLEVKIDLPYWSYTHKIWSFIRFADDIELLANSAIDAQTLLQTVEEIAASVDRGQY